MGQSKFTPTHKKAGGRSFNGRQKIDDMYDKVWEAYRKRFLLINFSCYACSKPADVCDHLTPHKGDEKLFRQLDNHIPLCTKCHNTVTTLFDRDYRPGNPITKKIEWLNKRRGPESRKVKVLGNYD